MFEFGKGMRVTKKVECEFCGEEFYEFCSVLSHEEPCCPDCYRKFSEGQVQDECERCGKYFFQMDAQPEDQMEWCHECTERG